MRYGEAGESVAFTHSLSRLVRISSRPRPRALRRSGPGPRGSPAFTPGPSHQAPIRGAVGPRLGSPAGDEGDRVDLDQRAADEAGHADRCGGRKMAGETLAADAAVVGSPGRITDDPAGGARFGAHGAVLLGDVGAHVYLLAVSSASCSVIPWDDHAGRPRSTICRGSASLL